MKKSIHGRFRRKSDGKIASIIKTQLPKNHGIILHTMEFEDDRSEDNRSRATVYNYDLKVSLVRING